MATGGNFIATAPDVTPVTAEHCASKAQFVPTGDFTSGYGSGFDDGNRSGFATGAFYGSSAARDGGLEEGLRIGFWRGFMTGNVVGLSAGVDTTSPTVTLVYPSAPPGQLGGFPLDRAAAVLQPIILQASDVSPGVKYVSLSLEIDDGNGAIREETIYRRGGFRGKHVLNSTLAQSGNTLTFTIYRSGGWLAQHYFNFNVDVIDAAGNLT